MFKLIKFYSNGYGVAYDGKLFLGTKIEAGNFAIDRCNADGAAICEVMAAFEKDGKNYADFGVNGGWTFMDTRDVMAMMPAQERGVA